MEINLFSDRFWLFRQSFESKLIIFFNVLFQYSDDIERVFRTERSSF